MNLTYYKVFDETGFIGVGTSGDLRKHQKKHNILVFAGCEDAQYISVSDELFHDKWMKKPTGDLFEWFYASVIAISQEEYKSLKEAIEKEEEINLAEKDPDPPVEEIIESPEFENAEITVEYIREVKLKELSLSCSKAITSGFDLEVEGEILHFSLTENDQLNLQDASLQIISGKTMIPYHADNGEYKMFASEDVYRIFTAANEHKAYHLAYFNCLKKWVNSLKRISSIQAVVYGSEIPVKHQSSFLKSIMER